MESHGIEGAEKKKRNYAAASPSIVLLLVDGWRMGKGRF
jgi:hypothetical protein